MKKLKKLMAALLVALMALAVIPAGAFAATGDYKWTPKAYKILNDGTEQTFTYTVKAIDSKGLGTNDAPSITTDTDDNVQAIGTTGSVTVSPNATATSITFKEMTLPGDGYYEFEITEDALSGYEQVSDKTYYAIVSVIDGVVTTSYTETKVTLSDIQTDVDANGTISSNVTKLQPEEVVFTNKMSEGYNIEVTKQVEGTASNPTDSFTFKVSVNELPAGYTANVLLGDEVVGTLSSDKLFVEVPGVKNGNVISTTALPEGTTVTVEETVYGSYTQSWSDGTTGNSKKFEITQDKQTATITNTKNAGTITGFVMHYTPYIALIAVAGVAVALIAKRRNHSEF